MSDDFNKAFGSLCKEAYRGFDFLASPPAGLSLAERLRWYREHGKEYQRRTDTLAEALAARDDAQTE